jgi:hypothetical protein
MDNGGEFHYSKEAKIFEDGDFPLRYKILLCHHRPISSFPSQQSPLHNVGSSLHHSLANDFMDGDRASDDLPSLRCLTEIISNADRREACTVTTNRTHLGVAETVIILLEAASQHMQVTSRKRRLALGHSSWF